MRFLFCALATLSISACDLIRDPVIVTDVEGALMVHGMLRSTGDTAMVLITRADTDSEFGNWPASIPVRGAAVDLVQGTDTLRLPAQQADDDACWYEDFEPARDITGACYVAHVPAGIDSGEEFVLLVETQEGERVEGRVTVPVEPSVLTPEPGAKIPTSALPTGNILVRWQNPAGNELHLGFETDAPCISGVSPPGSFGFQSAMPVSAPDSMTVQLSANCQMEWTRVEGRITLAAFDPGYGRYVRDALANEWTTPERAAVNLKGALGVFAAVASHEVPVVLERPQQP